MNTFKIDGVYCRLVPLTQGLHAIVDADDYDWLMQWKWHAFWCSRDNHYYAMRRLRKDEGQCGRIFGMHTALCQPPDGHIADHINRCGLDNRRKNLRPLTRQLNALNRPRRGSESGFRGVYPIRRQRWDTVTKWKVSLIFQGQRISVGTFDDILKAALAYDEAALKYHGEFAQLNFPLSIDQRDP